MIGVWGVLGPLKQRPLKLDGDLGDGVGRQLNQHLQEVGLHPVLGRLIVDVTWGPTGHPELFPGLSSPAPLVPNCPALGLGLGSRGGGIGIMEGRQASGGGGGGQGREKVFPGQLFQDTLNLIHLHITKTGPPDIQCLL